MPKKFMLCNEELTTCIPIDEGTLIELDRLITERVTGGRATLEPSVPMLLDFRLKSRRIREV